MRRNRKGIHWDIARISLVMIAFMYLSDFSFISFYFKASDFIVTTTIPPLSYHISFSQIEYSQMLPFSIDLNKSDLQNGTIFIQCTSGNFTLPDIPKCQPIFTSNIITIPINQNVTIVVNSTAARVPRWPSRPMTR